MGTPAAAITSLAKALDPSSSAAAREGPKQLIPRPRTSSATPGHQRGLRPDHDEVGAELLRERRDGVTVELVDVVQGRERRDAGVARGGVDLLDGGVPREGEREGVLAAAGADDEDLHVRRC